MKAKKLPSGKWNIRIFDYIDENGKQHNKSITADTKAECELLALKAKSYKGRVYEDTVGEAIDNYIELSELLSPTTLMAYRKIRSTFFQDLMNVPINKLTQEMVQKAINSESKRANLTNGKTISPKSVKNAYSLISSALKQYNVSFMVKLPKVQHTNSKLPEPEEVMEILKGTSIELPCMLAMWCGLRMGEVRGLQYQDVHDDELWINKTRILLDGIDTLLPYAKTDSSIRIVKLPSYVADLMPGGNPEDFIVPQTQNAIYLKLRRLTKDMNISFHDLRHMYASIMLTKLKLPSKVVQKSGGWKTSYVMEKIYSQTFSSAEAEATSIRDAYLDDITQHYTDNH